MKKEYHTPDLNLVLFETNESLMVNVADSKADPWRVTDDDIVY